MADRVFLHIGPPKTGTTYLQSVLWGNRAALQEQGLLLPLSHVRDHYVLASIARDDTRRLEKVPQRGLGSWDRMLADVRAWPNDVLISHELFAPARPGRARWVIGQLNGVASEVHLIITARDLARQIPATWQQTVKQGGTYRLREYCGLVRTEDPAIGFWRSQDIPAQVRKWRRRGVRPKSVHVVTVPPSRAGQDTLWTRFASVVSIDPAHADLSVAQSNESLGAVEAELLRRVNEIAPMAADRPVRQNMVRVVLAQGVLAQHPTTRRFGMPPEEHPWVVERGTAMVEDLRTMAFDLVGDLLELVPADSPATDPIPDDVPDADITSVAVQTISALLYRGHEHEMAPLRAEIQMLTARVERQRQTLDDRAGRIRIQRKARRGLATVLRRIRDSASRR